MGYIDPNGGFLTPSSHPLYYGILKISNPPAMPKEFAHFSRWMSMLGLASVLFCTLVAGVRYWDGSYFEASGLSGVLGMAAVMLNLGSTRDLQGS